MVHLKLDVARITKVLLRMNCEICEGFRVHIWSQVEGSITTDDKAQGLKVILIDVLHHFLRIRTDDAWLVLLIHKIPGSAHYE